MVVCGHFDRVAARDGRRDISGNFRATPPRPPQPEGHALDETGEMIFQVGLPAVILGLIGGWWLTRRALAPVSKLTDAVEKIHEKISAKKFRAQTTATNSTGSRKFLTP